MKVAFSRLVLCAALIAALPQLALAVSPSPRTAPKEAATVVDLFDGMKSGDIEVKVIPKDSTEGTVTVKNKTDKPLTIRMPEAFAGVPVLGQGLMGGDAGMMGGDSGGGSGGMNQGFGGGMMGGGMGMGGMGMGGMGGGMGGMGGFFNVGPEKVAKVKIVTVCMDHGKKDPNPRVPYKLVPIETYAKDAQVAEVIKMMVRREIDQPSAQAATWHLQNGLTWQQLATKIGAKHLNGTIESYFTFSQLDRAFAATRIAEQRAEEAVEESIPSTSVGERLSANR